MKPFVNQRLKTFIDINKIKQTELAEKIGKSRQFVNQWFKEPNPSPVPDEDIYTIIYSYKDLNARWFITGEGEMLADAVPAPGAAGVCENCAIRERQIATQQKLIDILEASISRLETDLAEARKPKPRVGYKPSDDEAPSQAAEPMAQFTGTKKE